MQTAGGLCEFLRWLAVPLLFAATLCVGPTAPASGQAPGEDGDRIALADGQLQLTRPAGWKSRPPRSRIVEQELEVPAHEDDPVAGRVTIMGAGGSVEANITRWVGQFEPTNGKPVERQVQVRKIANCDVHLVDLTGTYLDRPQGFRGPVVKRPDYRMLGAIIVTPKYGDYFVKLYGPKKTVDQQAEAFAQFIGSLEVD